MLLNTGVYCIKNNVNGKVYIGSTVRDFNGRWSVHLSRLRRGIHENKHLQAAWDKYGEGAFGFSVVMRCPTNECLRWEQWWIDRRNSADPRFGYNFCPIAGNCSGTVASQYTREKMSKSGRKRYQCLEERQRQSKVQSKPEVRKKKSVAVKELWKDPAWRLNQVMKHLGYKPSAEAVNKRSASNRGKKRTAKAKANISAGQRMRYERTRRQKEVNSGTGP